VHRHHVSPAMLRLAAEHAFMRKATHSMPLRVLPL